MRTGLLARIKETVRMLKWRSLVEAAVVSQGRMAETNSARGVRSVVFMKDAGKEAVAPLLYEQLSDTQSG